MVLDALRERCGFTFDENNLSPAVRQEITALSTELTRIDPLRHRLYEAGEMTRRQRTSIFRARLVGAIFILVGLLTLTGSIAAGAVVILIGVLPFVWVSRTGSSRLKMGLDIRAKAKSEVEWAEAQLGVKLGELAKVIVSELSELHEQMLHPRQVNLNVNMDFSWLRTEMEKGGLLLTTVKCPQCGGKLELPKSGDLVSCKYCGSVIHAVDVFDKLKTLLK